MTMLHLPSPMTDNNRQILIRKAQLSFLFKFGKSGTKVTISKFNYSKLQILELTLDKSLRQKKQITQIK